MVFPDLGAYGAESVGEVGLGFQIKVCCLGVLMLLLHFIGKGLKAPSTCISCVRKTPSICTNLRFGLYQLNLHIF